MMVVVVERMGRQAVSRLRWRLLLVIAPLIRIPVARRHGVVGLPRMPPYRRDGAVNPPAARSEARPQRRQAR